MIVKKFEIHNSQITEIVNTITPYSWFYPLYVHASETNDNTLPYITLQIKLQLTNVYHSSSVNKMDILISINHN